MSGYQIADEPAPSTFARFAVNPIFPMLAAMLGGVWIAWPWFAFNSIAIGSPTRRAELAWLGIGLVAIAAAATGLVMAVNAGVFPRSAAPYGGLALIVMKLGIVYAVHVLQSRTIEIYQYYGGVLVSGLWVLIAAFVVGDRVLEGLPVIVQLIFG